MTNTRRANRNIRNARRQGESDAYNRLATILDRLANPPLAASITNNYVSIDTLNIPNESRSETPSEPRTQEPKRKKFKSTQNYATPTPTANPNYTYTTQSLPTQTPTPKPNRKEYTGIYPLCVNCTFHHSPTTACRLCTKCNRLGHFYTNCRVKPLPANTTTQQHPRQPPTQTNSPQQTRKGYTGTYPLCVNCNFHHPTHTACRLCTSCNRLGHFATHCRTNPIPINSVAPTPCSPNIKPAKSCYECGDPNHFKKACPNLHINSRTSTRS